MAPEVIKSNKESPASDVWSLGCTIVELFTGSPPYSQFASMAAVMQIMKNDMPPLPEGISPVRGPFLFLFFFSFFLGKIILLWNSGIEREVLTSCLQKDPAKRATVEQLLALPWIKNAQGQDDLVSAASVDTLVPAKSVDNILEKEIPRIPSEVSSTPFGPCDPRFCPHLFFSPLFPQDLRHTNEEHLTLRVHLSDLTDAGQVPVESVMLFVFQDTHAAAMVDVALKQGKVDADPLNYCLFVVDNVTLGRFHIACHLHHSPRSPFFFSEIPEERRFLDTDFPKLEAEVLWQFESQIRFSIKKKPEMVGRPLCRD